MREGEVGVNLADGAWHTVNLIPKISFITIIIMIMMITIINIIITIIITIMMVLNRCGWGLPRKILRFVFLLMLLQV